MKKFFIILVTLALFCTQEGFAQFIQNGTLVVEKEKTADYRPVGWVFTIGEHSGYGVSDIEGFGMGLELMGGRQITSWFYLGIGTGLDYDAETQCMSIPLFINPRLYFTHSISAPYFDVQMGYNIPLNEKENYDYYKYFGYYYYTQERSGFFISPTFGYNINKHFDIGLGVDISNHKKTWDNNDDEDNHTNVSIILRLGYQF